MRLLIDRETLKKKIENDPDLDCEAGRAVTVENFDQFIDFLKVLKRDDIEITTPLAPEEEIARLRKYCSAAAYDYETLLERLIKAGEDHNVPVLKTFAATAAESKDSSEFLRMAAEGLADNTLYEDELTKATKAKNEIRDAEEPLKELRKLFLKKDATDEPK